MRPTLKNPQILLFWILFFLASALCPAHILAKAKSEDLPLPVRVVLAKVGTLLEKKDYSRAIEVITAFQARGDASPAPDKPDPKGYHHPEIYFALGTCHLLQQAYQPAADAYEQAVNRDPTHISAWLNLARVCYELKDYSYAAHCFKNAYEHAEDKDPKYLFSCATAHLMAEENGPCIAAFEKLFKNHAADIQPSWRENFVHALLSDGQSRRALPHIMWLAEHYTGEKQVQMQEILLHQYLQLDMHEQAQTYVLSLVRHAPTRAKWWKALTHVQLHAGRYKQALVALTVYGYLSPLSTQETKLLADLHLQLGIPVKAAPLYATLLKNKTNAKLLRNMVLALQQLGKPEEALKQLHRFAQVCKEPDLMMLRADLLYSLERFDEAGEAYRKAARADAKKAGRAWLMAGYAALQIDDIAAGRQAFERAAAFKRHRKAALLAMRQLPKKR